MLIEKDRNNQPVTPPLILAHKSGEKIGVLLPDPKTLTIKIFLENSYILSSEMSCDINKYINTFTNELWDDIKNFKLIFIPIDIPNFKPKGIWYEIEVTIDDYDNTVKHITGTMAQHAELSQVNNYEVEIRTEDDIDRDDYIDTIFYNPQEPKASIVHRVLNDKAKHYSIYHVDDSLKNIKRTFEFNGDSVLSNLQAIAEEVDCIIIFGESEDSDMELHRTVSFYDAKDYCPECGKRGDFSKGCTNPNCTHSQQIRPRYGKDSGIYINKENLGENINLSVDTENIKNCFRLSAGDDDMLAAIVDCNPAGSRYIWHFTDDMKENMSSALRERLETYQAQCDDVRYNYLLSNLTESRVNNYNAVVDKYQVYSEEELTKINRNDKGYNALIGAYYGAMYLESFLKTIMMPYSPDVIDTTADEQIALYTLTTLGVRNLIAISNTFAANEVRDSVKIYVDTSRYSVQVETASYDKTTNTWTGTITLTSLTDPDDKATVQKTLLFTDQTADYLSNQIDQLLKKKETGIYGITDLLKANNNMFTTEIKKYCLNSLSSISDVLTAVISIMDNAEITATSDPDVYTQIYQPYKTKIPIIYQELADRENDANRATYIIEEIQNHKSQMKSLLDIEIFLGETLWNELLAIRREDEQEDSNYISDGLTDLEIIANAQDFYDRAIEKIEKQAELQLTASCTLKDLLLLCPEVYDDKTKLFDIGNWMRIDIDEKIYKLRLVSYQFNYGDLTRIQVEFSDCKPSNNIISQFRVTKNQSKNNQKGIADISKQVSQNIVDINAILQPFYVQETLVLPTTSIVTEDGQTLEEYLKTEHIDTVVEIEEAKKVANNFMSEDNTGIMIAPFLSDTKYLPNEAPVGVLNTFIDNQSFNVRLGIIPIAQFSANAIWLGNAQNFSVTADGYLTATNATITGTITANTFSTTNGEISYRDGALSIDASALTIRGNAVATASNLQTAIADLTNTLITQIDAKIETWAQATNPKFDWAEEDYPLHDGDLWYYTGITKLLIDGTTIMPSKTYKYNNNTGRWELYKSPTTSLFDFADGKAVVFYGNYPFTAITNANENDLAIDNTTQKIYRYNGSSWIEVQNYSKAIEDLSDSLMTQIDGKVDTWAQATNPKLDWTEEDYPIHNGDLWYYTGTTKLLIDGTAIMPSKTYKYNNETGKWELYKSPTTSLFDFADGKATISYGTYPFTAITDANENDLAIDNTSQKIYRYDGSAWIEVQNYSEAIDDLRDSLPSQTDAKIETWVQDFNPASTWSSSEQTGHDDDLWLYTGTTNMTVGSITVHPQGVYQYNASSNSWTAYSSSSNNIFDLIDGKTSIYYGRYFSGYSGTYYQGTSTPANAVSSPSAYDMYYNSSTTRTYIYLNNAWQTYSHPDGDSYFDTRYGYVYEWKTYSTFSRWNQVSPVSNGDYYYSKNELSIRKYNGSSWVYYYNIENGDYLVDADTGCTYKWSASKWNLVTDYQSAINTEVEKYMRFESAYGLMIANMVNGEQTISGATSYNVLLGSTSLKIRNGTDVLAEYGSSIKLYKPGTTTVAVQISPTLASFTGQITADSGTIGGFTISSTSNTGTTASGGHFATNSIYCHTSSGSYEYETGIKGTNQSGTTSFYVRRISSGGNWNSGQYMFYVSNTGKLYAQDFELNGGSIVAASFKATGTYPSDTYTTIDNNIILYNDHTDISPYIMVNNNWSNKRIWMHADGISVSGSNYTKTLVIDSSGFTFSSTVKAPHLQFTQYIYTNSASSSTGIPVITCSSTSLLVGVHPDYVTAIPNTNIRGAQIRLYTVGTGNDKAGIFLGTSGSEAVTSDERLKTISSMDTRYEDFFNALTPVAYNYKVGHRKHLGFGAQSVERALKQSGLSTEEFAGLIIQRDIEIPEDEVITPDDQKHFDELYSLRYEEFIALNTMMIQKLQAEIKSLRNELNNRKD